MNNKIAAIESYIANYESHLKSITTRNKLKNAAQAIFLILLVYVVVVFTTIELLQAIK